MKSIKVAVLFVLFNALLGIGTTAGGAAQAKHSPSQRGGQTATHMNSRGSAHSNPQWLADPKRGWVRGDENHGANDQGSANKRQNKNRTQQNHREKKS